MTLRQRVIIPTFRGNEIPHLEVSIGYFSRTLRTLNDEDMTFFTVAPCMLLCSLYNPTHALCYNL